MILVHILYRLVLSKFFNFFTFLTHLSSYFWSQCLVTMPLYSITWHRAMKRYADDGIILMVLPPYRCFWTDAGDSFVAISHFGGHAANNRWVRLPAWCFLLVFHGYRSGTVHRCWARGIWKTDRRTTDRRIAALLNAPYLLCSMRIKAYLVTDRFSGQLQAEQSVRCVCLSLGKITLCYI